MDLDSILDEISRRAAREIMLAVQTSATLSASESVTVYDAMVNPQVIKRRAEAGLLEFIRQNPGYRTEQLIARARTLTAKEVKENLQKWRAAGRLRSRGVKRGMKWFWAGASS